MERIDTIITKLKSYSEQAQEQALLKTIRDHEAEIVDLNIEQLMSGLDAKGKPLKPYHQAWYADFKKTLNPKGVTDLKLTGAFHDRITLNTNSFPVITEDTDPKTAELVEKYGKDILDVPEQKKDELAKTILGHDILAYYEGQVLKI